MEINGVDYSAFQFAHPIEEEFARILDYYGIPWEYEPQSFALEWNEDGDIKVAFAPDFYLPEQDLYVELTTLRPKLITKKNRKILHNFLINKISFYLFFLRTILD